MFKKIILLTLLFMSGIMHYAQAGRMHSGQAKKTNGLNPKALKNKLLDGVIKVTPSYSFGEQIVIKITNSESRIDNNIEIRASNLTSTLQDLKKLLKDDNFFKTINGCYGKSLHAYRNRCEALQFILFEDIQLKYVQYMLSERDVLSEREILNVLRERKVLINVYSKFVAVLGYLKNNLTSTAIKGNYLRHELVRLVSWLPLDKLNLNKSDLDQVKKHFCEALNNSKFALKDMTTIYIQKLLADSICKKGNIKIGDVESLLILNETTVDHKIFWPTGTCVRRTITRTPIKLIDKIEAIKNTTLKKDFDDNTIDSVHWWTYTSDFAAVDSEALKIKADFKKSCEEYQQEYLAMRKKQSAPKEQPVLSKQPILDKKPKK